MRHISFYIAGMSDKSGPVREMLLPIKCAPSVSWSVCYAEWSFIDLGMALRAERDSRVLMI